MKRSPFVRLGRSAAAVVCALLTSTIARADGPVLVAPRVTQAAEPVDPRASPATRVAVLVEIDVDSTGNVESVRIVQPADEALDAAAIDAARRTVLEPATRDGVSVRARIRYEVVFDAKAEPIAPAPAAPAPTTPAPSAPAPADVTAGDADASEPATYEASAKVEAPPREVTRRTLTREELASIPGTRGDAIRAVEILPGVGRPAAGGGLPILRGANPSDTQVFLDGAPVPLLYHLGGLTSFVHGRVIESVDPRRDAARQTRLRARHGPPQQHRSVPRLVHLGQGRAHRCTGLLGLPGRRRVEAHRRRPLPRPRVRLGRHPRAAFRQPERERSDGARRVRLEHAVPPRAARLSPSFPRRLGAEHRAHLRPRYRHRIFGAIGRFRFQQNMIQARSEWSLVASPAVRLVAGVDALGNHFEGRFEGPPPPPDEGANPTPISLQRRVATDSALWVLTPGAYLEAGLRPVPQVLLSPGVRADYDDMIGRAALDPRFSMRIDAGKTTAIKAGVGRFSQSPDLRYVVRPIGNPDLQMTRATHASTGVEQQLGDSISASVDLFAKWLDGVVTNTPGGESPYFVNTQEGRIFGGELMVRIKPSSRFFGFLSYTLMRSERRNQGDPSWRLFDRDQPHILAATGVVRLGRGWETGAAFRYTSGTPYTPVLASTYDGTSDVYSARYGRAMSTRNPAFSRLDLRVQKTWTFSAWNLAAYLDVQNVLDSPNREGFDYSYDYRTRQGTRGLPILPILGLRGEL